MYNFHGKLGYTCCKKHRGQPKFILDETTNRKYFNDSRKVIRFKCFLVTLGTPFVHPIASIVNTSFLILKLATLSHFWTRKNENIKYNFKGRLENVGKDLLRIAASPISVLGLELAALYGIFNPYDGRKLYATIERATYGNFVLAPCFQPDPTSHAFGGNINKKNAF